MQTFMSLHNSILVLSLSQDLTAGKCLLQCLSDGLYQYSKEVVFLLHYILVRNAIDDKQ